MNENARELLARRRPLTHQPGYAVTIAGRRHPIPKDLTANLEWRRDLITWVGDDPTRIAHVRGLCAAVDRHGIPELGSLMFWLNAFAWIDRRQEVLQDGSERNVTGKRSRCPFIPYVYQDEILAELHRSIFIKPSDIGVDKSRKMGLSWLVLAVFHWAWQFIPDCHFKEMSRKEALVDSPGNPDCLMYKHDYLLKHQPYWLVPRVDRATLRLRNLGNGSTIQGESTNEDAGHAGRRTAVLFDEASRMRRFRTIWEGASQETDARIAVSTTAGSGFFEELVTSETVKVLEAFYYDHPDYGRGAYVRTDDETGEQIIASPWFDHQVARAARYSEYATNLLGDKTGGSSFFDHKHLRRHELQHAEPPLYEGDIEFVGDGVRDIAVENGRVEDFVFSGDAPKSPWRLWCDLEADENGVWRPIQRFTYVIGADISWGQRRSNSVLAVGCVETGAKVAEYASGEPDPAEFARIAASAGWWFGGVRRVAFMLFESNGAGGTFAEHLKRLRYPWLYTEVVHGRRGEKRTDRLGWHSDADKKANLLGLLAGRYARDEIVDPSVDSLRECRGYVWYKDRLGVGPAKLESESRDADATHGDRTIATALMAYGFGRVAAFTPKVMAPHPMSPAARRKARERTDR